MAMYHGVLEKLNTKERVNKSTINQVAIQYKRVQKRSNKKEMFDIRPKWKTIFENLDLKSWCNQIKTRNSEIERHNYEKVHIEKEYVDAVQSIVDRELNLKVIVKEGTPAGINVGVYARGHLFSEAKKKEATNINCIDGIFAVAQDFERLHFLQLMPTVKGAGK